MNKSGFNITANEAGGSHWPTGMSNDIRGAD